MGVSVREQPLVAGVGLLLASAAAWAALLAMGEEMPMGFGLWIGAWTLMMAAMMLPSTSPLVLLFARRSNLGGSRPGTLGAFRLGLEHGAYCVGCCWALMVVLVVAGAMSLAWVIAIALVVAGEKLLPGGQLLGRLGGVGLLVAGVVVAL